jgi:ribosomal protein S18 acetylase RimI-like enzyme
MVMHKESPIRPTVSADTPPLKALAHATGVFKPHELEALEEVLDDYHSENLAEGHCAVTYEKNGEILGFAYWAPAAMTDRTWYLYWIAVSKKTQAKGIGSALMRHVETDIRSKRGRILLIETSSLPHYDLTRKFYVKQHYEQEAVLRGFYADGDDMVIFRKQLGQ